VEEISMRYRYPYLNAEMPDKADVLAVTPNPAAREMIEHLTAEGIETYLDRFAAQQPLCRFGLQGTCCRRCLWGPCRVTPQKRGVCGADVPLVVISNHIRMVAAGCAAHGQHARLRLEAILAMAEGRMAGELQGANRVWWLAERFGLPIEGQSLNRVAADVARHMLDDLGRVEREPMKALLALAPKERVDRWRELGVLPTSAFSEVFETLQRTSLGTDSDWRNVARQELRLSLAFFWGCVVTASWASEILYGPPRQQEVQVGFGTLGQGNTVKLAVHGHAPVLAEAVAAATQRPDLIEAAQEAGAEGFDLYGICCTGQELLARHGIPTTGGILGQELIIGTGALDALVADQQCVIPGVIQVAGCFGTRVITTSDSARMQGATHIPLDLEHIEDVAEDILREAIAAYTRRKERPRHVPAVSKTAQVGWDDRSILEAFGGRAKMLRLIREGEIKGIATMVSCNTPKVPYEQSNVVLARELVRRNVLITTTGCASHALLNAGLADLPAIDLAGERLARACRRAGVPPVLPVGACVDNTRTMFLFIELAEEAGVPLCAMPFFYLGAEPGNEKALGMGMAFFAHGISVLAGYPVPVPVPLPVPVEGGEIDDYVRPRSEIADFFGDEARELVGARLYGEPNPELAAGAVDMDLRRKRMALGWG
jgi:carbon-monoxide dehydrogenase catalytic subunit